MTPAPSTLSIIGTGLVGASIGLAVRRRFPDLEVVGADSSPEHAAQALRRGALTRVSDLEGAIAAGDLIVLAVPLAALPGLLEVVSRLARPGAFVTDVGSVKGTVLEAAAGLPLAVRFVGGHPMAGSATGGPREADALLFENAVYVLTPPPALASRRALEDDAPEALWLVEAVGARAVVMSAERHDQAVAAVSHLPQLLAVALVEAAAHAGDDALALAAGGFRDMTRIAGSPFSIWESILRDNRPAVLEALERFVSILEDVRGGLEGSVSGLEDAFERAGRTRAALPATSKGSLAPLADVVVWADDRPGFLHALTGVVADAGLNLRDAELLRVRSGEVGTFRFGFESPHDADDAVRALVEAGYRAERR